MENYRVVAMDLFSGGGGMSLGARQAGVDVLYAVEKCPMAAATYRRNFPETPIFIGDIRNVHSVPRPPGGKRTVVFGGPPCQGFSTSNQRTRSASNPANWMFEEFIRVARIWEPDWIVIENVRGIVETLKGFFLLAIEKKLQSMGYKSSTMTLNAIDHGVPQRRERTFVVGSKDGSHLDIGTMAVCKEVTVGQAIDDLPVLASGASLDELPYQ